MKRNLIEASCHKYRTRAGKLRHTHVTVNICSTATSDTSLVRNVFARSVHAQKRANVLTRALSREKGKGDPCSELQAWWKPYCVLSNGEQSSRESEQNRSDEMKQILFVPSTFLFLDDASHRNWTPFGKGAAQRSKVFLSAWTRTPSPNRTGFSNFLSSRMIFEQPNPTS